MQALHRDLEWVYGDLSLELDHVGDRKCVSSVACSRETILEELSIREVGSEFESEQALIGHSRVVRYGP